MRLASAAPWVIHCDSRKFVAQRAEVAQLRQNTMVRLGEMGCARIAVVVETAVVLAATCVVSLISTRYLKAAHDILGPGAIGLLTLATAVSLLPSQGIFMRVLNQDATLALRKIGRAHV